MTHKSFLFSLRVFRWSISAYFVSRGDFSHSLTMQPTAGRRTVSLEFMKTSSVFFTRLPASRG